MIYDGHAYCFPTPEIASEGFADSAEYWRWLQLFMTFARQQPSWRRRDRAPADGAGMADMSRPWDFDALKEAGFRIENHGLVEWSIGGERYVKQALPPWTVNFSYPPDSLVAEMDYAGIERALIHRTPYMTDSNTWVGACVRRFPDRLDGLAHIPEWRIEDETDAMIAELYQAINSDGLVGLQFMPFHRQLYGQSSPWDGDGFRPFWEAVRDLGITAYMTIGGGHTLEDYLEELGVLRRWMETYPEVTVVCTHGFNWRLLASEETLEIPAAVYEAAPIGHPSYHVQILFAVFMQSVWDYPMPQIRPALEQMIERIGADRIIWGTDIPIVMLHWTYRQSLDYIRSYCDFIPGEDMELILGGNMARLLGLAETTD